MSVLSKMIEKMQNAQPHPEVGLDEHRRIVERHKGDILPQDVHQAVWDILIAPMPLFASLTQQTLHPYLQGEWKNRPIHSSMVNSSAVNAVAMPGEKADHILIFRGLAEQILGYSWCLFGTREFLPQIGQSQQEQNIESTARHLGQRADLKTGMAPVAPRCHSRQLLAALTAQNALHIALLHEHGHILGGHFQLFRSGAGCTALDEMRMQKEDSPFEVPLSVIEWDADCFAANFSFFIQNRMTSAHGVRQLLASIAHDPANLEMVLWTVAGHILFRSIAASPTYTYVPTPSRYPPPPLRGVNFLVDLVQRRGDIRGKNKDATAEVFAVAVMIEAICARRFGVRQENDWIQEGLAKQVDMMKLYAPYRDSLEKVRRISESWRPIYRY